MEQAGPLIQVAPESSTAAAVGVVDNEVLARLKAWRKAVADAEHKQVIWIATNAVLEAVATVKPQSADELHKVKGVGAKLIENRGDDILAIVRGENPPVGAVCTSGGVVDEELLERLKAWRYDLANEQGVPSFKIVDNHLHAGIAEHKPTALEALDALPGVGPVILEKYGAALLAIVNSEAGPVDSADQVSEAVGDRSNDDFDFAKPSQW